MAKSLITPAEISKMHDISYQTVNYYTNLGLLKVEKKIANSRLYNSKDVNSRLKKLSDLKSQGYSLRLICGLLRENR
ncbi:MAG: MerR family transcriptional regulator [Candidatus Omnitrophica bacterium]|nr:MerR family transcriptional regulator [Candidatus Omnitrophota bacterium]